MKIIAKIYTDFPTKFGIPRQSGIINNDSVIIFEPEYRKNEALRGISEYSHLWLIWEFSEHLNKKWTATVRPPRLGGNKKVGVFATRSPFRPNPIGLSSVELIKVKNTKEFGNVLIVRGADMLNETPIYDIKPYLSYTDTHQSAKCGFTEKIIKTSLKVEINKNLLDIIPLNKQDDFLKILSEDPRPHYINDNNRIYGFKYLDLEIKFKVTDSILKVLDINKL